MKIKVTKDNVTINKDELYHAGEYNIHNCTFEFSKEYTDILVKKALFGVDGKFYEMSILNNQCEIPYDVLKSNGMVILGVYAYEVLEDELKLRYSPMYDKFFVNLGSYQENIENQEEITSTQFEQYMQALQNGLAEVQSSIDKLNETTDNANNLVDDINKKLESGEFNGVGITTITSGQATQQDDSTVTPVTVNKTDGSQQTFNVSAKNGINGTDGTNGQDGITPKLQIGTVTTLEPNEQATVTRTGTDEEPLFNFGIPKGQTYQVNKEDLDNIANEITSNANSSFNQNVKNKTDSFNENSSLKTNEFNNNAAQKALDYNNNCISKINSFNQNSTQKLTEFNDNYASKLNSFNSNADLRMDEYNANADNKIAEYDEHSQELNNKIIDTRNELERVKNDVLETGTDTDTFIHVEDSAMAEMQELSVDGVCEQETTSIANGDEYDSPSPDYPQEIKTITDSLIVTSCGKNIFNNTTKYPKLSRGITVTFENQTYILNGTISGNYADITDHIYFSIPLGTYKISVDSPKNFNIKLKLTYEDGRAEDISILKNESYKVFTITKKIKFIFIFISGLTVGQELNDVQFKLQLMKNASDSSVEDYIQSQITANLPEGEFIGKIDDTYKDTLKVEYNEEDGQYHLNLYKMVGKRILNSGDMSSRIVLNTGDIMYRTMKLRDISINKVFTILCNRYVGIEKPANRKDGNIYWNSLNRTIDIIDNRANITTIDEFKTWLSTHNLEVYYVLENPYTVDLGVVDMPLSYNEITNIFTDSDLLPTINAKYYRNFITTVQNLQVNEKALKQELIDINNRLSALETATTNVTSESEVVE